MVMAVRRCKQFEAALTKNRPSEVSTGKTAVLNHDLPFVSTINTYSDLAPNCYQYPN